MNKKIEPPKPRNELRLKQEANASLVQIEGLDYILDNLIQNKKKKSEDKSDTSPNNPVSTSSLTSSQLTTSSNSISNSITNSSEQTSTPPIQSKTTSVSDNKVNVEDKKKVNLTETKASPKKVKETKDKKNVSNKEELSEGSNKKIKVEEKKPEVKKPKRKKVFQACVICRKSHISCDNKRPCTRCVKKGIAHLCHDAPKKGSNMMDCNSCPIFPLLKGPYPFHSNMYKPPTFPNYSTSILNSQLNPSPLTNFPIPLLNQQKVNSFPPPNSIPPYPGLNTNPVLMQQQFLNQKQTSPLTNTVNQSPHSLQSSLQTLKQAIQNQQNIQSPQTSTMPPLNQQPTPPLTAPLSTLNPLTPTVNNTTLASTFPLTSNTQTLPLSNNINVAVTDAQTQPTSRPGSLQISPTSSLPNTLMSPINVVSSPAIQNSLETLQQALQNNVKNVQSPHFNSISQKSQQTSQDNTNAINATISEMNSISSFNTTTEDSTPVTNLLNNVESPHYALPDLEFSPSKPCVPFSSVTPIFSSDYMNNEFSALVNFCQNVSHENGMPSRCKNCPFSRTEQFFLKAADNANPNVTIEDQLKDIIKEKYKAGLLKPYNYSKGYLRLQKYLDENISIVNKQKILNAFNTFQKGFKNAASNITDWDLLSSEESFERLLLEYDRVFASVGIPSCLWRRTGEICKANRHFAYLVGVPVEQLNNGKTSIYEFMTEDFVANYWEKYSVIAFDNKQKAVITSCVLENPQSFKRSIKCAFSFTVRRDKFDIPSAIIGNFMPYNPQLIYKDPFATNGMGLLGFLSPYSTPSYQPLPRGETGYKGCGCSNTQCCSSLKKEVKTENNNTNFNHHDDNDHHSYDDHHHNSSGGDSNHHNPGGNHECHHHDHDHSHDHNYDNDHNNNSYTHNYTNTTASQLKLNSNTLTNNSNSQSGCPKNTKDNIYCNQCEMSNTCSRKNSCSNGSGSCGNQCACSGNNDDHFYNANNINTTQAKTSNNAASTSKTTNDPVMNEFMNLDMESVYPATTKTPATTVPLMVMKHNNALDITTSNPFTSTVATLNPFINFSSPLQTSKSSITTVNVPVNTSPLSENLQSPKEKQQLHQQQLEQLQQALRQKIMNQNKDNNLPSLPTDDIRNELPDDLLFSILNSK